MTALRNSLKRRVAKLEAAKKQQGDQRRWWIIEYGKNEEPVLQLEGNEEPPRAGDGVMILPANGYGADPLGTYKNGRHISPGSGPVIPYYWDPLIGGWTPGRDASPGSDRVIPLGTHPTHR